MEIVMFLVIFSVIVGFWANSWGRNGFMWGLLSLLVSPVIAGIALLIAGKTLLKKAEEQKAVRDLMG